jgi:RNA recognition motif-containing protein
MDQSKTGQGYIGFKDHESAKNALDKTNMKTQLNGQAIFVSSHIYKKENEIQKGSLIEQNQKEMFKSNLYVKFIPLTATKDEVEKVFKKAGDIISIKLKNYEISDGQFGNKTPKYQIGYVLYESVKQAQKAIQLFYEVRGLFPE